MRKLFVLIIILSYCPMAFCFDENFARKVFESRCSICHPLEWPLERRKTKEGWKETVKRMRKKTAGNVISEEDERIIVEYLTRIRGK